MSNANFQFSIEEDERLVEIISNFPIVYDPSLQTAEDNAWKDIAEFVERTVDDCKKRWKSIRKTYYKRQRKENGTGTSASSIGKLDEMLMFLKEVDHKRENVQFLKSESEDSDDADIQDILKTEIQSTIKTDQPSQTVNIPSSRRSRRRRKRAPRDEIIELLESRHIERQKIIRAAMEEKSYDAVDLFFKSIASSVKKLRPDLIHEAKKRSLEMIIELEKRNTFTFCDYAEDTHSTPKRSDLLEVPSASENSTTISDNKSKRNLEENFLLTTRQTFVQL